MNREILAVGMVILLVVGLIGTAGTAGAQTYQSPTVDWQTSSLHTDTAISVTSVGDTVYSGSEDNTVVASHLANGSQRWSHSHHNDEVRSVTYSASQDAIVSSDSGGDVVAASASSGSQTWTHSLHGTAQVFSLSADSGTVFSGGEFGTVVAADASDGSEKWNHSYHTGTVKAVDADGGVVYTGGDDEVVAADASDGSIKWNHSLHSGNVESIAVADGTVFSLGDSGQLVAADASDGSKQWSVTNANGPYFVASDLRATADAVYMPAGTDVVARSTSDGSLLWQSDHHNNTVAGIGINNGTVLSGSLDTTVAALDDPVADNHSVAGTVVDSDGNPVANPTVEIRDKDQATSFGGGPIIKNVSANSSGVWNTSLTDGNYSANPVDDEYLAERGVEEFSVSGGDVTGLTLKMFKSYNVSGQVLDADTGDPVPGATVDAIDASTGFPDGRAVTDSNGRYEIQLYDRLTYYFTTDPDGYQAAKSDNVTISGSDVTGIDLVLERWGYPYVKDAVPDDTYRKDRTVDLIATVENPTGTNTSATIRWYNGTGFETVANETVSPGGTITGQVESLRGENTWLVKLDGNASQTFQYRTPGNVTVYNRTDLTTISSGSAVVASSESDYRDERTITDGALDLEGVPDETLIVRLSADGYADQTLTIDDPAEQWFALLAPEQGSGGGNDTVRQGFELEDRDGAFPASESYLAVEQYYRGTWRTLGSDYFGAANNATFALEDGATYRLTVRNDAGDTVSLGEVVYRASDFDNPEPIIVRDQGDDNETVENKPPVARWNHTPRAPETYETIHFDATAATDPDGEVVAYRWDFDGDGITDTTGARATHQYVSGGNYTVSLTVEDGDGATDTAEKRIYVASLGDPPVARYGINESELVINEQITFDANASEALDPNASITDFDWAVSDGRSYSTENITINFGSPGNYTINLTVTDSKGRTDTTSRTFYVGANQSDAIGQPTAAFDYAPTSPSIGEAVTFNGSNSSAANGSIDRYRWDVDGDGAFETTGEVATHEFQTNGTYRATLEVTDSNGQTNQTTQVVTVGGGEPDQPATEPPIADINATPTNPAPGESAVLNASGSDAPDGNITDYEWDVGDDGSVDDRGAQTTVTFDDHGVYTVTLTVTDDNGLTDTTTVEITVGDGPGGGDDDSGRYEWDARIEEYDEQTALLRFEFNAFDGVTVENFQVRIFERGSPANELRNQSLASATSVVLDEPLDGHDRNATWVVEWSATIDGERVSHRAVLSPTLEDPLPALDPWIKGAISTLIIWMTAGLFSRANAGLGGVIVSLEGGVFWLLGWLGGGAGIGVVVLALGLSLYFKVGGDDR